jgi:hypothetical protein
VPWTAAWKLAPSLLSLPAHIGHMRQANQLPETKGFVVCAWQGRPLDHNKEALIANVRGTECMRLAWHPVLPLLAIGWKDGKSRSRTRCGRYSM